MCIRDSATFAHDIHASGEHACASHMVRPAQRSQRALLAVGCQLAPIPTTTRCCDTPIATGKCCGR
eukprot:1283074-Prymnesium_polylepis.1